MKVFSREDGYLRYDFVWYGFGYDPSTPIHTGLYRKWWINSYRSAPFHLRTVNMIGWQRKDTRSRPCKIFAVHYSGSMVEPWSNWYCSIGRFMIGGRTPKWVLARKERKAAQEWEY